VQVNGNVHEAEPGQLYRSAQINGAPLRGIIFRFGIRSVINLRGGGPNDKWYCDEAAVAKVEGAVHFDVPMSAGEQPSGTIVKRLVGLLQAAPRPQLVNCKDGAGRLGLAAALSRNKQGVIAARHLGRLGRLCVDPAGADRLRQLDWHRPSEYRHRRGSGGIEPASAGDG
jgi:hypothetical protein